MMHTTARFENKEAAKTTELSLAHTSNAYIIKHKYTYVKECCWNQVIEQKRFDFRNEYLQLCLRNVRAFISSQQPCDKITILEEVI
jgi:hypothetical protein